MRGTKETRQPLLWSLQICSVLLLTIVACQSTFGQTVVGRISGTVQDSNGASVPNASVKVINSANNSERTVTSDENGFYTVTNLPVGTYTIEAEQKGYKKALVSGQNVTADARLTVDLKLEAGEVSETVEIVGAAGETVNTTSGEVARVIDQQQVQNLALNGRNYIQLLSLVPGVALLNDDQLELTTSLATGNQSINGNRGQTNNVTVDGGFNLQSGSNASQINNVGIDYIQEVKIQTSNFSAEYGRNSGAQVSLVTRSGGNDFHGSAFEFIRNDKLDARSFFAPVRPTLRFNNFGYSIGGPIFKDKLFFFGGQEWKYIRRLSTAQRRTVPTLAELNGDFSFRLRGADGIVGTADDGVLRDPNNAANTALLRSQCTGVVTRREPNRMFRRHQRRPAKHHSGESNHRRRPRDCQRLSHGDRSCDCIYQQLRSATTSRSSNQTRSTIAKICCASTIASTRSTRCMVVTFTTRTF